MSTDAVAVAGFAALFALMMLRVPVGIAMGAVGVLGFGYIVGDITPALKLLAQSPIRTATDAEFAVIPLFLLMGAFASASGMSRELFRASNTFLGHMRGGLGIATIVACGGFAAICGSSVATAATFSKVAYPEMRQYGYPQSFATGVIAAGGSLGIMIPPSTVFAVYGLITEQDIGKLFIAGIVPGIVLATMLGVTTWYRAWRNGYPRMAKASFAERVRAFKDSAWGLLLIVIVMGGIYSGLFTPTEAAAMSAVYAFVVAVFVYKDLKLSDVPRVLLSSANLSAMLLYIITNAILFSFLLTYENIPQALAQWITSQGLGWISFLLVVNVMLLLAGNVMEPSSITLIMAPILFPVAIKLGINPIHFGILMVVNMEVGLCHPPVGLNLYVTSGIAKMGITELTVAVWPWLMTMLVFLAIVTYWPALSLALPRLLGMM
ncbi:MAG: TRAP transporter large permease [Candidatus Binataceae bacterium]